MMGVAVPARKLWVPLLDRLIGLYAQRRDVYRKALAQGDAEGDLSRLEVLDRFEELLRRQERYLVQAEGLAREARQLEDELSRLWGIDAFTLRVGEIPAWAEEEAAPRLSEGRALVRESRDLARRLLEDVRGREDRLRAAMGRLLEQAGVLQAERKAAGAYRVPMPKARFFDERR
ncbi:hypothetical protein [Limnochorda pilosa]|uniref:Flagellar biosynthesis protein FlgN n=1 Tax=Limnochorda pilosa TaxID=1555112 RepID=A0A0K2SNU7_LIMPI|nr:hypothetical protein [Limnochorda pilosa]BAS28790.1 hypothetical protein LIP_2961 [Limnochorda pilosa]